MNEFCYTYKYINKTAIINTLSKRERGREREKGREKKIEEKPITYDCHGNS